MTSQVFFQALASSGRQGYILGLCWGSTTSSCQNEHGSLSSPVARFILLRCHHWWQSGSMACRQGGGCKNFYYPFSLPRDNSLLPQHPPLRSMFHIPHTQTQVYAHRHPSRAAMPLPCFPSWWAPWHFAINLHGHRTRNLEEVFTFVVWKIRKTLLSALDHPSPLRRYVWHQNRLWIFHSTLQLGRPQRLRAWWHRCSFVDDVIWAARRPLLSRPSTVLSHTCSICANIFLC